MIKKITSFFLKTILIIFIIVSTLLIGSIVFLFWQSTQIADRVYPNVYVNGINIGGKTTVQIEEYFLTKTQKLQLTKLVLNYQNIDIATFSGKMINLSYDTKTIAYHAISIGRSENLASKLYQRIKTLLRLGRFNFTVNVNYDPYPLNEFLDNLEEKYNKPAENALFKFENGKVTAFAPEKNGLQIQREKALNQIEFFVKALDESPKDFIVQITDETIKPEISLSSSNNLGIVETIGEGVSDFTGSIPGRIHNIILASSHLNGVLIAKDELFSFNQTIGDISAATGYKPAYIIKNGRTVLGDGGGVCQVSTTLFRAGLNAGLPIVERSAHAYRVHYYENDKEPGFDATVFNPSNDLKIKNDTSAYILIQTVVDKTNNKLTFTFYGKKDGRTTEISDIKLWDVRSPPTPVYQDDPTLKKGITRQVDWPAPGGKASFHYKVIRDGETLIDQDFFSSYRPWRAVYLVGTME